ncbi:MAG: hypothetical protein WA996_01580 [Candidatus Promineifilaceae bacterium]
MESIKNWIKTHPNITAWIVLALGMVAILVWEASDVGLETNQWFWLIVVTILVAGACIWIISWGDDEEEEEAQLAQAMEGESVASEVESEQ